MPDQHLHIISFSIPYPPNYGGIIDVFYKLKWLHKIDVKIHLHCFEYDRQAADELNDYCESVNYYRRKTGMASSLSLMPYIVKSRHSERLMKNLLKDDHPILFEGLHSCYYLSDPRLKDRVKIYRESNIEHQYYLNLFKAEKKLSNKAFFLGEAFKLRMFQKVLGHASLMLAVSQSDADYLQKKYRDVPVHYLPSFHPHDEVNIKSGKGNYALYHGNLSVPENVKAAEYIINKVFSKIDYPLIMAGLKPHKKLQKLADKYRNVTLVPNPSNYQMDKLISNAQVNILITFQATGLKLKLLNVLHNGRFVLVNTPMLSGTGLDSLCHIADTAKEIQTAIQTLSQKEFDQSEIQNREAILGERYSNRRNGERVVELVRKVHNEK